MEGTFSYSTEVEPVLNSNCCCFPKPTYFMAGETENYIPELSGKLKENMKWINTYSIKISFYPCYCYAILQQSGQAI